MERLWKSSIMTVKDDLDLKQMNLDGSHAIAKKGGQSVISQTGEDIQYSTYHRWQRLRDGLY